MCLTLISSSDLLQWIYFDSRNQTSCYLFLRYIEVSDIQIDMEGQKVFVESTLSGEELLEKLKKTGRECAYIKTH